MDYLTLAPGLAASSRLGFGCVGVMGRVGPAQSLRPIALLCQFLNSLTERNADLLPASKPPFICHSPSAGGARGLARRKLPHPQRASSR